MNKVNTSHLSLLNSKGHINKMLGGTYPEVLCFYLNDVALLYVVQLLDMTSMFTMVPLGPYLEVDVPFQRVQRAQLLAVVQVLFQKIALQAQLN